MYILLLGGGGGGGISLKDPGNCVFLDQLTSLFHGMVCVAFQAQDRGVTQRCTFSTGWCFKLRIEE